MSDLADVLHGKVVDKTSVTYFRYGKLHRVGGPAIIEDNGEEFWYVEDRLHRLDGPAITFRSGDTEWWVDGDWCRTKEEFQELAGLSDIEMTFLALKYTWK